MRRYVRTKECLMAFLARELGDDATASKRCGKCSNCIGRPLYDGNPTPEDIRRAEDFLVRRPIEIAPRKRLPSKDTLQETKGIKWSLDKGQLMELGRAMSYYGFGTMGSAVKKFRSEHSICPEELAASAAEFIKKKWFHGQPLPFNWITPVPSSRTPHPLSAFMPRLAEALGLPLAGHALLSTGMKREPQELLRNSHTQLKNLDGEYTVDKESLLPGSALLVDDICSSRWTLTLTTALLRQAGVPKIWPLALSMLDPHHVE
jgi:ATP-dependent DNA helicase RecQ